MLKKIIIPLVCLLLIAGAAAWLYRTQSGAAQHFDQGPYRALGFGVAEETARALGKKGQVVVIAPDTSENPNPSVDSELDAFQETAKKNGLTIAETVRFKLAPQDRMATGGAMPADQFLKILRAHPNAGAVVSLCAFPFITARDLDAVKQPRAKLIVASGYLPGYRNLLESQILHLAIIPRFDRSQPAENSKTLRELFNAQFTVITPEKVATLPW